VSLSSNECDEILYSEIMNKLSLSFRSFLGRVIVLYCKYCTNHVKHEAQSQNTIWFVIKYSAHIRYLCMCMTLLVARYLPHYLITDLCYDLW